jgi:hypothetical protein
VAEEQAARQPILRQDGTILPRSMLMAEVQNMMDHLEVGRADEHPTDVKGKATQQPRHSWEVREFLKKAEYEYRDL